MKTSTVGTSSAKLADCFGIAVHFQRFLGQFEMVRSTDFEAGPLKMFADRGSPPQSAMTSSQQDCFWSGSKLVFGSLILVSVTNMPQVSMTSQGFCSYFVRMPKPIETFGDVAELGMMFRVECACGRTEYFDAKDLARVWGRARPINRHRFRCTTCKLPKVTATPIPIDMDRIPKGHIMRLRAGGAYGDPEWQSERYGR